MPGRLVHSFFGKTETGFCLQTHEPLFISSNRRIPTGARRQWGLTCRLSQRAIERTLTIQVSDGNERLFVPLTVRIVIPGPYQVPNGTPCHL